MPLINCKINLIVTWCASCITWEADGGTNFAITDTKPYFSAVTLSTIKIRIQTHNQLD